MTCCHFFCSAVFSMPVWRYPMVGDADTTVSPSSCSTSRSTPCVLGCCGPMFTVIVSVRSIFFSRGGPSPRSSPLAALKFPFDQLADGMNQRAVYFLHARGDGMRHVHVQLRGFAHRTAVVAGERHRLQPACFCRLDGRKNVRRLPAGRDADG